MACQKKRDCGHYSLVQSFVVIIPLVLPVKMTALDRELVVMNISVLTGVIRNVLSANSQSIENCLVGTL